MSQIPSRRMNLLWVHVMTCLLHEKEAPSKAPRPTEGICGHPIKESRTAPKRIPGPGGTRPRSSAGGRRGRERSGQCCVRRHGPGSAATAPAPHGYPCGPARAGADRPGVCQDTTSEEQVCPAVSVSCPRTGAGFSEVERFGAAMARSAHVLAFFVALFLLHLFGQGTVTHTSFTPMGRWFGRGRGCHVSGDAGAGHPPDGRAGGLSGRRVSLADRRHRSRKRARYVGAPLMPPLSGGGTRIGRRRGAHVTLCQHQGDIPVCSAGLAETNRRTAGGARTDPEHRTFLPEHKPRAGRFE